MSNDKELDVDDPQFDPKQNPKQEKPVENAGKKTDKSKKK
jgi:hypothetical protein